MSRLPENLIARHFSFSDLAQCAERESRMRRQVYRNRVLTNRMSQQTADREIDMMMEIAELLRTMSTSERLL